MNNFTNYAIEIACIGYGGSLTDSNSPTLTIDDLFHRHHIKFVDLIKLDIEGSEFALFDSTKWLERVKAISMEVHPLHGNPNNILQSIIQHGFTYAIADENLQCVKDTKHANFIYAWKNT